MKTVTRHASFLTIFLADGMPDGLRTVVKAGWIGHFIVCPRLRFPEARTSEEFARPGVYVLCGPSEDGDLPTIYVGEGDPTRPRLEQHYRQKDFWTSLVLFTAKDQLTKAHVQYLESRLVSLAKSAKRCILDTKNDPQLPTLAIAETASMENFLEEMLLIFPLLGLTVFEVPSQPIKPVPGKASPGTKPGPPDTTLYLKARGIKASGYDRSEGFVVLAGSEAVGDKDTTQVVRDKFPAVVSLRKSLVERGVLVVEGNHFKFTQDYMFNSPSQAASVALGSHVNGLDFWKDDQGRALKDIRVALPQLPPKVPPAPAPPAPASAPTTGGFAQSHRSRLAKATAAYQHTMNILGAGQTLTDTHKKDLSRHLSVMSKQQLRSLYAALGGTAAIQGSQRQPWVHRIKDILSGVAGYRIQ